VPLLIVFVVLGVALLFCGGCICKKLRNVDDQDSMINDRKVLIDAVNHKEALNNTNDNDSMAKKRNESKSMFNKD